MFAQNAARKFLPMQRKDFVLPVCSKQVLDCFQKLQTASMTATVQTILAVSIILLQMGVDELRLTRRCQ